MDRTDRGGYWRESGGNAAVIISNHVRVDICLIPAGVPIISDCVLFHMRTGELNAEPSYVTFPESE